MGHQVLFVRGSIKFKFSMATELTTLIYLTTLFAKPVVVVRPEEIFQEIRVFGTVAKLMNPVVGKL